MQALPSRNSDLPQLTNKPIFDDSSKYKMADDDYEIENDYEEELSNVVTMSQLLRQY